MPALQIAHAGQSTRFVGVAAFLRAAISCVANAFRSAGLESATAAKYRGRSWCDATEQSLSLDIASRRWTRN